jgi:hypothetical protein
MTKFSVVPIGSYPIAYKAVKRDAGGGLRSICAPNVGRVLYVPLRWVDPKPACGPLSVWYHRKDIEAREGQEVWKVEYQLVVKGHDLWCRSTEKEVPVFGGPGVGVLLAHRVRLLEKV